MRYSNSSLVFLVIYVILSMIFKILIIFITYKKSSAELGLSLVIDYTGPRCENQHVS